MKRVTDFINTSFKDQKILILFFLYIVIIFYGFYFYIYRSTFPLALDVNEAWTLSQVLRWSHLKDLYPSPNDLIINNYPPLFFVILNLFHGDPQSILIFGRLISILSIFISAIGIFLSARLMGYGAASAVFGSLWYLQNLMITAPYYVGMNDPSLFATSLMAIGFTALLLTKERKDFVYLSIILQILGGFIKHNTITLPLISFGKYMRDFAKTPRDILKYILFSISLLVICLSLCIFLFGQNFIGQLFFARQISFLRGFRGWEELPWDAVLMSLTIAISTTLRKKFSDELTALALAFILFFLQKMGDGVSRNASFELELVICFLMIKFVDHVIFEKELIHQKLIYFFYSIFLMKFMIALMVCPLPSLLSAEFRKELRQRDEIAKNEIARIAQMEGNISCGISLICALAGKPLVLDQFAIDQKIKLGSLNDETLRNKLNDNHIVFEKIEARAQWPKKFSIWGQ